MANYKNEFGKIDLPWTTAPEPPNPKASLTHHYWIISQSWNGHGYNITVAGAFEVLNNILNKTDPKAKLAILSRTLNEEIVQYGTKRQKQKSQKQQ